MPRPQKKRLVRDGELMRRVVRLICDEFHVTPREISRSGRRKENLLYLMAIFLAGELGGLSSGVPAGTRRRFKKYLKFIPGLSRKYEELKKKIIKKGGRS